MDIVYIGPNVLCGPKNFNSHRLVSGTLYDRVSYVANENEKSYVVDTTFHRSFVL